MSAMFTVVPLVVLLALTATGVKGDHPGFKARITQDALDYAIQQATDALEASVTQVSIPNQSGTYDSSTEYSLTNIGITGFDRPSTNVRLVPGTGVSFSAADAGASFNADYEFAYTFWGITLTPSGSLTASISGLSFTTTIALVSDSEGRPSLQSAGCTCTVDSASTRFHSSAFAWILNMMRGGIESRLREMIPEKLCAAVEDSINTANRKLQQWQGVIPLTRQFQLDFRFVSPPDFQTGHMDTEHKGEITWSANPQSPPFSAGALPPHPSSDRMVNLWVGDYLLKSFLYAAQEHGYLHYNISAEGLSPNHRGLLNTTCTDIACVGHLIPAIGQRYPGCSLALHVSTSSVPVVRMLPGKVATRVAGNVELYVNTPQGTRPYLATLSVSLAFNLTARIANQVLFGNISGYSLNVGVVDSNVGHVDSQEINTFANVALETILIPLLNGAGNRGYPLPATGNVRYSNTQLQIQQNAVMVGTDLIYRLSFTNGTDPSAVTLNIF